MSNYSHSQLAFRKNMSDSRISPRKLPQQERARATVEAILDATAQLLVEEGYHKTSTNKIAKRAGVSVGSLYQYFPNKEAVVAGVVEAFADDQMAFLGERLLELQGLPLEEAVHELVVALLEAKQLNPDLHQVLFEHLPPIGQIDVLKDWTDQAVGLVTLALDSRDELEIENPQLSAFVLISACHGIIHTAVVNSPHLLADENFSREVAKLILGYVR